MEAWEPRRQGKTETQAAALLIHGDGKIDLPAFDRLAASRDDTEMDLRE